MADENITPNTPPASSPAATTPEDKLDQGKSHARQAAEDLRAAAEAKAQELRTKAEAKATEFRSKAEAKATEFRGKAEAKATEFRGKAERAYEDARVRARSYRSDGEQYVRENPSRAILGALAVGFVLGLVFRR